MAEKIGIVTDKGFHGMANNILEVSGVTEIPITKKGLYICQLEYSDGTKKMYTSLILIDDLSKTIYGTKQSTVGNNSSTAVSAMYEHTQKKLLACSGTGFEDTCFVSIAYIEL